MMPSDKLHTLGRGPVPIDWESNPLAASLSWLFCSPPGDLLRPNLSKDALVHSQEGLQEVQGGEGEARGGGGHVKTAAEQRYVKPC